jgi:starch-binding outer membrane protein, SusD/RagB family
MIYKTKIIFLIIIMMMTCGSCKKYLDKKSDKSLVIPGSLADLQALLDNFYTINEMDPSGGEICSDNYYLADDDWDGLYDNDMRLLYTWEYDHVFSSLNNMWNNVWQPVYNANVVLDNLPGIARTPGDLETLNNIKGQALYTRAREFHLIACTWCMAYDSATSDTDLGIPLRLTSDFNMPSVRSDNEATYNQIINDLKEAIPLLPVKPLSIYRPSKPAAYALLARVYLSMRKYEMAGSYADSCLQLYNTLLDYNTLDVSAINPVSKFNVENIMYGFAGSWGPLENSVAKTDSVLYASYDSNDLRKTIFFNSKNDGTFGFRGNYSGSEASEFTGPVTDEVYLMRAECYAREGKTSKAMDDLNMLLSTRWKTGTFVPFTVPDAGNSLQLILIERRKELICRELRWMDIKRLNKEGANIVLKRIIKMKVFTLPPNSPRYALPLPEDVIRLTGMPQNPQ